MEPVTLKQVVITAMPSLRAGIAVEFRGQEEDANGEAVSEFVSIELVVPPLNLDSMRELEQPLSKMGEMSSSDALAILHKAIKQALRRNYRGVPDWLISQSLDVGNMQELSIALMDVNGLRRKEIEAGKARAALENPPIGTQSSVSSSPAPAIPGQ